MRKQEGEKVDDTDGVLIRSRWKAAGCRWAAETEGDGDSVSHAGRQKSRTIAPRLRPVTLERTRVQREKALRRIVELSVERLLARL